MVFPTLLLHHTLSNIMAFLNVSIAILLRQTSQFFIMRICSPHAFSTMVYLINHMLKVDLFMKSSIENLFNITPNYFELKIFGCLCVIHGFNHMSLTSLPLDLWLVCFFFLHAKCILVFWYSLKKEKKIISRRINFIESIFPFSY